MSLSILSLYLAIALLLAAAWPLALVTIRLARASAEGSLRIAQVLYAAALALPCLALLVPGRELGLHPAMQVYSGSGRGAGEAVLLVLPRAPGIAPLPAASGARAEWWLGAGALRFAALAILAMSALAILAYAARVGWLARRLGRLAVIRAVGGVRVLAGDEGDPIPYAARLPGQRAVVLPLHLFRDARELRLVTAHELQHHRQGDTAWVHLVALVRAVYFWHPAAVGWSRMFDRLQEVACDAALIGRRRVSPQAYGRCLLRAAEIMASWPRRLAPAGTAGLGSGASGSFLRRRIEMILNTKSVRQGSSRKAVVLGGIALVALVAGAAVSRAAVEDRRVAPATVAALAEKAAHDAGMPVESNELVVERLNRFLGTPERRQKLKEEIAAMGPYQDMIENKLAEAGMPAALLALPLFESGFQVDRISSHHAAGIWQFIPETARRYGLAVNGQSDERFDASKETDAAIHYLTDLHLIFGDWRLALRAYNEGESHLIQMIRERHTRDPWELERAGSVEEYLPGAVAMMIILKNPSFLDG